MKTKRTSTRLKLPDDLIGNLRALLNTPPPPKESKKKTGKRAPKVRPRVTK